MKVAIGGLQLRELMYNFRMSINSQSFKCMAKIMAVAESGKMAVEEIA